MARSVKPSTTVRTLCMGWASFDYVLLEKLSERVVLQPIRQRLCFQPAEVRRALHALDHNHFSWLKLIEQRGGLRRDDQLRPMRRFLEQLCEHFQSVGMQTEFRLINDDRGWGLGLQQRGCQTNESYRAVGELPRLEGERTPFLTPLQP